MPCFTTSQRVEVGYHLQDLSSFHQFSRLKNDDAHLCAIYSTPCRYLHIRLTAAQMCRIRFVIEFDKEVHRESNVRSFEPQKVNT